MEDSLIVEKAKSIKLLVLDVDGVMTDGKIYYGNYGDELKAFIDAVKQVKSLSNDGTIGAKTVELVKATKESLETGKTVSL